MLKKALVGAERLTKRFVAGIVLYDIVSYSWHRQGLQAESSDIIQVSSAAISFWANLNFFLSFYSKSWTRF